MLTSRYRRTDAAVSAARIVSATELRRSCQAEILNLFVHGSLTQISMCEAISSSSVSSPLLPSPSSSSFLSPVTSDLRPPPSPLPLPCPQPHPSYLSPLPLPRPLPLPITLPLPTDLPFLRAYPCSFLQPLPVLSPFAIAVAFALDCLACSLPDSVMFPTCCLSLPFSLPVMSPSFSQNGSDKIKVGVSHTLVSKTVQQRTNECAQSDDGCGAVLTTVPGTGIATSMYTQLRRVDTGIGCNTRTKMAGLSCGDIGTDIGTDPRVTTRRTHEMGIQVVLVSW